MEYCYVSLHTHFFQRIVTGEVSLEIQTKSKCFPESLKQVNCFTLTFLQISLLISFINVYRTMCLFPFHEKIFLEVRVFISESPNWITDPLTNTTLFFCYESVAYNGVWVPLLCSYTPYLEAWINHLILLTILWVRSLSRLDWAIFTWGSPAQMQPNVL